jgi:hypothetical protein
MNNAECLNCPIAKPVISAARALKTGRNECTSYPWWFIVGKGRPRSGKDIPFYITGPFFSRDEAEKERKSRIYNYSEKSFVWCASGHATDIYATAIDEAVKRIREEHE